MLCNGHIVNFEIGSVGLLYRAAVLFTSLKLSIKILGECLSTCRPRRTKNR